MERAFRSFTPVWWNEPRKFSAAFYGKVLLSQFGSFPYSLMKYRVAGFRRAVESVFQKESADVLVCDGLPAAAALIEARVRPRVVFERNIEFKILKRKWSTTQNPLRRLILGREWRKTRTTEEQICREFEYVISVSEQDRSTFRAEFGIDSITAVPTGVDAHYFQPLPVQPRRGNLVFVGSMDWQPNEDGIFWFVKDVYPQVKRAWPGASLTIVGRNPSSRLRALAAPDSSVEITGTVDDVRPYLAAAEVVVVPLLVGSGTRIKIFEAMAMSRPVVSTTIGAEGLPVNPGKEILLADAPGTFADAVVGLLRSDEERRAMAQAARDRILAEHTWDSAAKRMHEILTRVVSGDLGNGQTAAGLFPAGRANVILAK
jgi:glycosyltransferase involved in cell wall biosynthesis